MVPAPLRLDPDLDGRSLVTRLVVSISSWSGGGDSVQKGGPQSVAEVSLVSPTGLG